MKASLLERGWTQYAALFIGCGLYAVGLNWFIVPLGLYSGGMVGVVQLLSLGLTRLFPILGQRLNLYGPAVSAIQRPHSAAGLAADGPGNFSVKRYAVFWG